MAEVGVIFILVSFFRGSREHVSDLPPSSLYFPVPAGLLALIQQKQNLYYRNPSILCPFGFRGAEPELKITANSTYWKVNLHPDAL